MDSDAKCQCPNYVLSEDPPLDHDVIKDQQSDLPRSCSQNFLKVPVEWTDHHRIS